MKYLSIIVISLIFSSCLKMTSEGDKTYISYYMADTYFEPIPYEIPKCGLPENTVDATLKKMNGRWIADKPYIQRDYIVKFRNEQDSNMVLTFKFPLLRRSESASYFYTAYDVWTAKGPNAVGISGRLKESGFSIPIIGGDPNAIDTLSVLHTGNYFRVQGCNVKMTYNVNGLDVNGVLNFDLGWEDLK